MREPKCLSGRVRGEEIMDIPLALVATLAILTFSAWLEKKYGDGEESL